MSLPTITFLHFTVSEILPRQNFKVKVAMARSKVKSWSLHDIVHPLTNVLFIINFLHLTVFKIEPGKDFIGQGHYGKVKSRSHYDAAHLHLLTQCPYQYQLPTSYGFRDIALTRFSNSRSLRQGQRSNQGHTMTLHTYNP